MIAEGVARLGALVSRLCNEIGGGQLLVDGVVLVHRREHRIEQLRIE